MFQTVTVTAGAMLFWAILSVASRIVLLRFGFDPWAFSFLQFCAGGVALVILSSFQKGSTLVSFARLSTWLMGSLRVISGALYTTVLGWVSVLEAGTVGAMSTPVIALVVWALLRRPPVQREWIGHLIILATLAVFFGRLDAELRSPVYLFLFLNALCLSGMSLLAEHHPENNSDAPGARLRFTGTVLLVTAAVFLVVRMVLTGSVGDLTDPTLITLSVAIGILLRAPGMYLSLWAIRLAGAQSYTAAIVLLPLFGMIVEQLAVWAHLLDQSRFTLETLGFALVVSMGVFAVLGARAIAARQTA